MRYRCEVRGRLAPAPVLIAGSTYLVTAHGGSGSGVTESSSEVAGSDSEVAESGRGRGGLVEEKGEAVRGGTGAG
jgi:hypothetical protein